MEIFNFSRVWLSISGTARIALHLAYWIYMNVVTGAKEISSNMKANALAIKLKKRVRQKCFVVLDIFIQDDARQI